jgi:multiple sugar transport system permease protein
VLAKTWKPKDIAIFAICVTILILFLFPIYWMIATSFKSSGDILVSPPRWVFQPTLENYIYAFTVANFGRYIVNTLIIAIASTIIVVGVGTLAAYSFARYNVGGGNLMFFILTTRMMPAVAVVFPYFLIFRILGDSKFGEFFHLGLDRLGTLVICYTIFNLPFAIWLLHSFFQDIPVELEDSARLDGYSRWAALWKIVFPLAKPGIAVTAIFCLLFSWNEFLFAFILTRSAATTITVGTAAFFAQRGLQWGPLCAAATVCVVPMVIFILLLQRYIVRGLTFGAVRG